MDYKSNNECDCMILNFWPVANYGAILTCYGVQCLMEKLGKKAKVIKYFCRYPLKEDYSNSFTEKFAEENFNLTDEICTYEDFIELNNYADIFITGSDQVWNPNISGNHHMNMTDSLYLLDFVKNNKIKLSYSASFGTDYFNGTEQDRKNFKHFLSRFDGISVREDSGVEIVKNDFNQDAVQLIDGAFLIPKEKLDAFTSESKSDEKYIGCYVLPYYIDHDWYKKELEKISKHLNLPIKYLDFNLSTSVEDWLSFIKNAEFIITDSFHAIVFSIIFNRPFIQVKNAMTQSRFESLYRLLGIKNPFMSTDHEFSAKDIENDFNWDDINKKIKSEVKRSENWVKNVINIKKEADSQKDDFVDSMITYSRLKEEELNKKISAHENKEKNLINEIADHKCKEQSLTAKINDYQQKERGLIEKINLLKNKDKIYREYYRTRLCANLTFGEKKEHYLAKKRAYKSKMLKIKEI